MRSPRKITYKPKLKIAKIGVFRFGFGIVYGLLNAALFFCFTFALVQFKAFFAILLGNDIPHSTTSELFYEKLFLIAFSIAFGNNAMIRCWFARPNHYFDNRNRFSSVRVVNYANFVEYTVWFVTGTFIGKVLFPFPDADYEIFEIYGYVMFIIPVYLFYISWTEIIRYTKAQSWMWKTFVCSFVLIALVSFIDISNYRIGEAAFRKVNYEEISYVEREVEKAKREYNIEFSEETIRALKELRTARALDLLTKSRKAFQSEKKVSLDTIIFQKIMIHNFKGFYKDKQDSYAYIFPSHAYEQLKKVPPTSDEATELLNILLEFYELSLMVMESTYEDYERKSLHSENMRFILQSPLLSYIDSYSIMKRETITLLNYLHKTDAYRSQLEEKIGPFPLPPKPDYMLMEKFPELKN